MTCWGLGFLDPERTRVGCLLHPAINNGKDLRDLTGWGNKCRREACREAVVHAGLSPDLRAWLARLAAGLNAFAYSSRRTNPLFHLLMWGPDLIRALAGEAGPDISRGVLKERWAVLWDPLKPDRDAHPVGLLLGRMPLEGFLAPGFVQAYCQVLEALAARHRLPEPPLERRPYVHQLGLPAPAARFLRTALGWRRADGKRAAAALEDLRCAMANLGR